MGQGHGKELQQDSIQQSTTAHEHKGLLTVEDSWSHTVTHTTVGTTPLEEWVARSTWQHKTLTWDIHALGGIRTHYLSRRAAADLGPHGHWDRRIFQLQYEFLYGRFGLNCIMQVPVAAPLKHMFVSGVAADLLPNVQSPFVSYVRTVQHEQLLYAYLVTRGQPTFVLSKFINQ